MNIWAFLAVFFLDRLSKAAVERELKEGLTKAVVPNRLYFTRIRNYGFARGILSKRPELVKRIMVVTMAVSFRYARRGLGDASPGARLGFSMMLGGGASNLADRLKKGYVTDFIRFSKDKALVYNVADLFIFAGMAIFAVFSMTQKERRG